MINVTQTFLPSQEAYQAILKQAWDAGWITNRGALVKELEAKLQGYLNIQHLVAMTNGTLPLQIAIKALKLTGEIITTPFSYVATTSSIVWEGCTPVFVDIDRLHLTIDETKIEAAITPKTSAILATHVFGNPCNIEFIAELAQKYNLKIIYDAAHCFGVRYKGKSVFDYGDISTCSFHATKLFHTGEGGALFTRNEQLLKTLFTHHNFGHDGPLAFHGLGINAKMSELQAAMGLAVLPHVDEIISDRGRIITIYEKELKGLQRLELRKDTEWNNSYYPVLFSSEAELLTTQQILNEKNIFPRRYFYPSLNTLPYVSKMDCPIAESVSKRILCLPLYYGLKDKDVYSISNCINLNR